MRAFIGLGANLGDPVAQVRDALDRIAAHPRLERVSVSPLYRTAPLGPAGQPDYCNAVCEVRTGLLPSALLAVLHDIERAMGRQRPPERWAPRLIDLDLLHVERMRLRSACLVLPHPEMHLRPFVMTPLSDLVPDLELPGHGTVGDLARGLGREGVARWGEPPARVG